MSPFLAAQLLIGLFLLVAGAELLVRGASRLALRAGLSPLVVGLTVVAFGTGMPELAVSVQAALEQHNDLAVGNVVGSNIFNVLLVLGASALVVPLAVSRQVIRREVPLMVAVSALLAVLALDGRIGRLEGLVLLAGLIAYTYYTIRAGRRETSPEDADALASTVPPGWRSWLVLVLQIVLGLVLLVVGARVLVGAAVAMAEALGVSSLIIGLTIVAAGTSLPEAATSIVAAVRGEREMAVGNAVGSNIYNILAILGLSSLVARGGLEVSAQVLTFDLPVMLAVAIACLPVFFSGLTIARWEGAVFVAYYVAYTTYLVLIATGNMYLATFRAAMLWFVIPLSVLTILVVGWRTHRHPGRPDQQGRGAP